MIQDLILNQSIATQQFEDTQSLQRDAYKQSLFQNMSSKIKQKALELLENDPTLSQTKANEIAEVTIYIYNIYYR